WSSDVCSSDLALVALRILGGHQFYIHDGAQPFPMKPRTVTLLTQELVWGREIAVELPAATTPSLTLYVVAHDREFAATEYIMHVPGEGEDNRTFRFERKSKWIPQR